MIACNSDFARRNSRGNHSQHNINDQSLEYVYRKKSPVRARQQASPYLQQQYGGNTKPTLKASTRVVERSPSKKTRLSDLSGAEIKDNASGQSSNSRKAGVNSGLVPATH